MDKKFAKNAVSANLVIALTLLIGLFYGFNTVASTTPKLVTAGGTVTEIVFALGAGAQVVAVDQSSQFPARARQLPMVGYYRDLSAEGVLSFLPDKLLTITGAGRAEVLTQLQLTGVDVITFAKPKDVDGLATLITALGQALSKETEAQQLIADIRQSLPEKASGYTGKALYLLSAGDRGLVAAGKETVPNLIFSYAGIENLAASHAGFKSMNAESLTLLQPDFIVAPAHVVTGAGGREKFCQNPNLALLAAAQRCQLLVMDSLLSLGMTPRLAQAIAIVKQHHLSTLAVAQQG